MIMKIKIKLVTKRKNKLNNNKKKVINIKYENEII